VSKLNEQKVLRFFRIRTHVNTPSLKEALEMYEFDTLLATPWCR